ncbi:MAG TPA: PDZ domain-containing protein [Pirellulaceae bacterium]|jgi:S1-C subfamily serine protease|nr:PDZ domain-containing protein [Pirellulaceae bacterium]
MTSPPSIAESSVSPRRRATRAWALGAALSLTTLLSTAAFAAEPVPFEAAAASLTGNVCTVRAAIRASDDAGRPKQAGSADEVRVYSAICLADGLLICPLDAAQATSLRITFPGGAQDDAALKAFDEHSGLALLHLKEARRTGLIPAKETPAPGQWVLGAAGWGAESPVVSVGLVSGVDRTYVGSSYPPLLQADVRAAETSAGGPIVDAKGNLLGVIVQDGKALGGGWTYAVPVSHVERLVRAYTESRKEGGGDATDDSVIVLQRRRPTVGMILEGKKELVVVAEVENDGPADRAGLAKGDVVVAADGVQIRSVYQAIRPTLFKQPGDEMSFRVLRGGEALSFTVVLGGGVPLEPEQSVKFLERSAPKVVVKRDDLARYFEEATAERPQAVAETAPSEREADLAGPPAKEIGDDEARKLLEKALERYRKVIELQREEIELRREENELLARELERLSKRIDGLKQPAASNDEGLAAPDASGSDGG